MIRLVLMVTRRRLESAPLLNALDAMLLPSPGAHPGCLYEAMSGRGLESGVDGRDQLRGFFRRARRQVLFLVHGVKALL